MIEDLRREHELTVYASAQAYEFIQSHYCEGGVAVRQIPGLCFRYSGSQKLNYPKTTWFGIRYVARLRSLVRRLEEDIENDAPELAIVDYEPSLPRAALRCGLPFISLDHQHFLVTYDLSSLPARLKRHAAFMGKVVRSYYSGQKETVVSSFYFPPLKSDARNTKQIGVILRPEIIRATPELRRHVVAYFRRSAPQGMLEALNACGCEVRVYGLGVFPPSGHLRFLAVHPERFVEDLATSRALITTAGNQLVGEALYLRKPILASPEKGNYEQSINGHFLEMTGAGWSVETDRFSGETVRSFMQNLDRFRYLGDIRRLYGNPAARATVLEYLPEKKPSYPRSPLGLPVKGWASA
jgi:uncharacterized protein (TIGR00661 family)